jgi:hypothetical protein
MSNCSGLFGHMLRQLRSMLRHNRSPNKVRMDPLGSIFLWASYRRNVYLGRKETNPLYIIWYNNWIPYDIIFSRICLWWCTRIWDLSVFVWGVWLEFLLSVFTSDFCICVCRCQYCGFNLSVCSRSRHWIILSDLLIYHTLWMTIRCTPMINHWQDRMNHDIVFPDESSGRIFSTGRTSFTWFVLKYIFVCLMWMQTAWW